MFQKFTRSAMFNSVLKKMRNASQFSRNASRHIWFTPNKPQSRFSWWLRHMIRAVPIGFITFTVFRTGYAMGLADYAEDPVKMDSALMENIVKQRVQTDGDEKGYHGEDTEEFDRVSKVAFRILAAAKVHCKTRISEIEAKLRTFPRIYRSAEVRAEIEALQEELETWEKGLSKVQGRWNIVVIKDSDANAFITDICPRRIFVHEGLLTEFDPSDDELGMILGHEVSHVILGHVTSQLEKVLYACLFQLIFLSFVDPFGILSLLLEYYSFEITNLFNAFYSRERELEADSLGIKIAATACYNVHNGSQIFKKFGEKLGHHQTHWYDTHPSSDERFELLQIASEAYLNSHHAPDCKAWRSDFERASASLLRKLSSTDR